MPDHTDEVSSIEKSAIERAQLWELLGLTLPGASR